METEFERRFKDRDESNLNRQTPAMPHLALGDTNAGNIAIFARASAIANLRD
jgi:hypothetical protein